MLETLSAIILVLLAANLWVSVLVFRDEFPSGAQRFGQLAIVWFLPFIGALLVFTTQRKTQERGTGQYPEEHPGADDFGTSGQSVRTFKSGHSLTEDSPTQEP